MPTVCAKRKCKQKRNAYQIFRLTSFYICSVDTTSKQSFIRSLLILCSVFRVIRCALPAASVTICYIDPKRTVFFQYTTNFPKYRNQFFNVLFYRFFKPDLSFYSVIAQLKIRRRCNAAIYAFCRNS